MNDLNKHPSSSIKSKIVISFVLVIIIWGGAVNIAFQLIQESILQTHDIDPGVMREMMRHFIVTSSLITMSIIVIAILLALAISNWITLPIKDLTQGAKEVADGNLDIRIGVQSHDEIGQLSNAFNRMVAQRKHAEQTIVQSLADKELLLKEIHHRVKNNMAIISSMLAMQSRKIQDIKSVRAFLDSRNRIMAMALIHDNLYQSEKLTEIKIEDYFQTLINKLMESYGVSEKNVKVELAMNIEHISIDKLIPCGLIVNELVSNSLKYAFPAREHGKICLSIASEDDRFLLQVGDNGAGIPESFDIDSSDTLGLQIVKSLAVQLRGELQLKRNGGTTFIVSFPVKESASYQERTP